MDWMRDKRTLAVVAAVIVGGFIASVAAFTRTEDPEPEPTTSVSASATPSPRVSETPVLESTCADDPTDGAPLVAMDDPGAWTRIQGDATLAVEETSPPSSSSALRIDGGQRSEATWFQHQFEEPLDLSAVEKFRVWVRQNGNVRPVLQDLELRLVSTDGALFSRKLPDVTLDAATGWCQDVFSPEDLWISGSPDLASITAVQIMVPEYGGAGAGNVVWWGELTTDPATSG